MKRLNRSFALCSVLALAPVSSAVAEWDDVRRIVNEELERDGVGGLSVGVVRGTELVFEEGFGLADMERGTEATAAHVYRIGSITKQITAFAFVKLGAEGALRPTDPVERYVPELAAVRDRPEGTNPITLLELATMTSGLAREPEDLPTFLVGQASDWAEVVLRALPRVRYDFPPDTRYQYSNIGYAVLGLSLERASGRDYMAYVREEILEPLGMTDTDFVPRRHFEDRLATGYDVRDDGKVDFETPASEHLGRGYKVPNGALYSTVSDLARFISFQLSLGPESVLGHDRIEDHFSRVNSADGNLDSGYGVGFRVERRGSRAVYGHGGSVAGYRAACIFDRESKTGVVVLRNVTGDDLDVMELAHRILELAAPAS